MNLWEKVTGSDLSRLMKSFERRVKKLPADYRAAWVEIQTNLWGYSDFTGRNLPPVLDGVLGLLEEAAADGQSARDALGGDLPAFCRALAAGEGHTYRDKWRKRLNANIAIKLGKWEGKHGRSGMEGR